MLRYGPFLAGVKEQSSEGCYMGHIALQQLTRPPVQSSETANASSQPQAAASLLAFARGVAASWDTAGDVGTLVATTLVATTLPGIVVALVEPSTGTSVSFSVRAVGPMPSLRPVPSSPWSYLPLHVHVVPQRGYAEQ